MLLHHTLYKKGDSVANVVILGAGLTGLSAAYHFEKAGFYDFEIFEKQDSAGGLLRSFEIDGFTFDYTGHLLHINDEYFSSFINTITNINTFNKVTRNTAIYSNGKLTDYPFQMNLFGLPNEVIYECITGYVNRPKNIGTPKNFYEWVLKYFGIGMGKHFFFPYNSKILAYDIKKILPSWTGRFVPKTDLETVLRGAFEKKDTSNVGYNSQFFYPKNGGIQHLITSLQKAISAKPTLNQKVVEINIKSKTIVFENGSSTRFKHLISTLPLNELLLIIKGASHRNYTTASENLICNSVINFNLGFRRTELTNKHWIYYPEKKYPFYRMGFWHNINPNSVKKNHTAIYGEVSYLAKKTSSTLRDRLLEKSIASALKTLGIHQQEVIVRKDLYLNHAYVIYDAWREQYLKSLVKDLATDGILSTGRYGGWKYSSMQEAVIDGKEACEKILPNFISPQNHVHKTGAQGIQPL